jgi:Flp pilus assembly protein TadD
MPSEDDLEILEYRSLVSVYEQALRERPRDLSILYWLGHAYTRLGRFEEGLAVDLALTALRPRDATARYNLACSYALLDRPEEALDALEEAIRLGYREAEHMVTDEDLSSLHGSERFERLLADLRGGPGGPRAG